MTVYTCSMFLFGKKSAIAVARKLAPLGVVSTGHHAPRVGLFTRITVETEMAKHLVNQHFKRNLNWIEIDKIKTLDNVIKEV